MMGRSELKSLSGVLRLANALVVLSSTAEDGEIEVRISLANALVVLSSTAEDGEIEILTTLCVVGILSCASADLGKLEATTAELLTPETQDYGTTASDYNDKETTDYFTTASGSDITTSGQDEVWTTPVTASGEDEFTVTAPDYLENYSEIADESLNEVDVNITVDKVEEILASNPNLPRLSRAEILEILDNITNDEQNSNEYDTTELRAGESATENANYIKLPSRDDFKTREDYMRALMVVLPYSAKNLSDTRIQELYTKPPITWLLTNTTDELSTYSSRRTSTIRSYTEEDYDGIQNYNGYYNSQKNKKPINRDDITEIQKPTKPLNRPQKPSQDYYEQQPITKFTKPTTEKYQFSEDQERYPSTHKPIVSDKPIPENQPEYSDPKISEPPTIQTYQTRDEYNQSYFENKSTSTLAQHREEYQTSSSTDTPKAPSISQQNKPKRRRRPQVTIRPQTLNTNSVESSTRTQPITSINTHEEVLTTRTEPNYVTERTTLRTTTPKKIPHTVPSTERYQTERSPTHGENYYDESAFNHPQNMDVQLNGGFKPIVSSYEPTISSLPSYEQSQQIDFGLPNEMKNVLSSLTVGERLRNPEIDVQNNNPIFVTASPTVMKEPITADTHKQNLPIHPAMRNNVKEVLAAIGLFPEKEASLPYTTAVTSTEPTTTQSDASVAAESLTQEMKDLLVSIGLLPPSAEAQREELRQESLVSMTDPPEQHFNLEPTVDPSSYFNFKPLPDIGSSGDQGQDDVMNSDMKHFLASFGLMPMSETGREAPTHIDLPPSPYNYQSYRSQKSLDIEEPSFDKTKDQTADLKTLSSDGMPLINKDIMSEDMMDVLENLGFVSSDGKKKTDSKKKPLKKGFVEYKFPLFYCQWLICNRLLRSGRHVGGDTSAQ
uniref:Uncharacterized protein n=1 Tax=Timema genevievae TaxID=629358 RepID=A0A7R9K0M7_TIMGE|nr:unnamed protein product [Timema genevievae]